MALPREPREYDKMVSLLDNIKAQVNEQNAREKFFEAKNQILKKLKNLDVNNITSVEDLYLIVAQLTQAASYIAAIDKANEKKISFEDALSSIGFDNVSSVLFNAFKDEPQALDLLQKIKKIDEIHQPSKEAWAGLNAQMNALFAKVDAQAAEIKKEILQAIINGTMGEENFNKWKAIGGIKGVPGGVAKIQKIILKNINPLNKLNKLTNPEIHNIYANMISIAQKETKPLFELIDQIDQKKTGPLNKLANKLKFADQKELESRQKIEKLEQMGCTVESTFYMAILGADNAVIRDEKEHELIKQKNLQWIKDPRHNLSPKGEQLFNAIQAGIKDPLWEEKGTGMFSTKVPSGIDEMRKIFANNNLSDNEKIFYCIKIANKHASETNTNTQKTFYKNIGLAARSIRSLDTEAYGRYNPKSQEITEPELKGRADALFQKMIPAITKPMQQQAPQEQQLEIKQRR